MQLDTGHNTPSTLVSERRPEQERQREFKVGDSLDDFRAQMSRVVPETGLRSESGTTYSRAQVETWIDGFTASARTLLGSMRPDQLAIPEVEALYREKLFTAAAGITRAAKLREFLVETAINEKLAGRIQRTTTDTVVLRAERQPPRERPKQPFAQANSVREVVLVLEQLYATGETLFADDGNVLNFAEAKKIVLAGVKAVEDQYKAVAQTGGQLPEAQIRQILLGEVNRSGRVQRVGIPNDLGLRDGIIRIVTQTYDTYRLPPGVSLSPDWLKAEKGYRQNLRLDPETPAPLGRGEKSRIILQRSPEQSRVGSADSQPAVVEPPTPVAEAAKPAGEIPKETLAELQQAFRSHVTEYVYNLTRHTPSGADHSKEVVWTSNQAKDIAATLEKQLNQRFRGYITDMKSYYNAAPPELRSRSYNMIVRDRPRQPESRVGNWLKTVAGAVSDNWEKTAAQAFDLERVMTYHVSFDSKDNWFRVVPEK